MNNLNNFRLKNCAFVNMNLGRRTGSFTFTTSVSHLFACPYRKVKKNKLVEEDFMKKLLVVLLTFAMVFSVTACSGTKSSSSKAKILVGVSMPTQSEQRWNVDGPNMVSQLKADGYDTILQYANNDVNTQVSQIENMITLGAKVLVITAIDGTTLTGVLKDAHAAGVKVIAYDRLIMQSPYVDYYCTYDNFKVGVLQGQYLESKLNLKTAAGPFNIEVFAGSPADNNAVFFFNGAMSVLTPYITSGKLVVKSGQTKFENVATADWLGTNAQARMDNLITANYSSGTKLDAVLSPNDGLAIGIEASLKNAGFSSTSTTKPWPIITGQDCSIPNIKAIIAGDQAMSIYKDTRAEAAQTIKMVDALEKGGKAPVNDTKSYNNGVEVVPSYLLTPVVVDKSNYNSVLVGGGYYTAAQLQ
jgi:putative multiple sugar transport system substrate-binding protein